MLETVNLEAAEIISADTAILPEPEAIVSFNRAKGCSQYVPGAAAMADSVSTAPE